jgi:hypothetical protein
LKGVGGGASLLSNIGDVLRTIMLSYNKKKNNIDIKKRLHGDVKRGSGKAHILIKASPQ